MLTATYSMIAIANEQNKMRQLLRKLQQTMQNAWSELHGSDIERIESAFNKLTEFDHFCHRRKVEIYLIPAVREATSEADPLLAELDALSATGRSILRSVGEQLGRTFEEGSLLVGDICNAMELYCHKVLTRLAKEEAELFPLVRRLFSIEQWFPIAAKFLSQDGPAFGRRQLAPVPLLSC